MHDKCDMSTLLDCLPVSRLCSLLLIHNTKTVHIQSFCSSAIVHEKIIKYFPFRYGQLLYVMRPLAIFLSEMVRLFLLWWSYSANSMTM